jgi:hypothetical protein
MTTVYFGERWDAPRVDDATQIETPIGQKCLYCTESIKDGDRGLLMPWADVDSSGIAPVHMECDLRMGVGDVAHLEGQCGSRDLAEARSWREEAREVLAWFNGKRALQGRLPL